MASVEKRGKKYRVRIKNRHGRWSPWKTIKAHTGTQAQNDANEMERAEERIRLGLEKPIKPDMTFADAVELQLATLGPDYESKDSLEGRLNNRITPHLGKMMCREITPGHIKLMLRKNDDIAAGTREQLRMAVSGVFTFLIDDLKHWDGLPPPENPAGEIPKIEGPKRVPRPLDISEIPRLMAQIPEQHFMLFVWSVATGPRKGESFAALKTDVSLARGTAVINGSHGRRTTKQSEGHTIGIPHWLIPLLRDYMKTTEGPYLFPWKDGERRPRWQGLHRIIKSALRRAGIVDGYHARCVTRGKRKKCGFSEIRNEPGAWTCKCGKRLVVTGIAKPITFHNLRTTFATWALAQGGSLAHVQEQLGHKDAKTTRVYVKIMADHLRAMADGMDLGLGTPVGQTGGHARTLGVTNGHSSKLQLPAKTREETV